ncbi:hypothetical protein BV22DRAFT_1135285 [Leucogyrophana mollusca]|uniref:Uncharacterized protein n=1 Tax=Leucogyrophana mollusca TaxID=85980 RepID=A0ACB8AW30_9AGAM|nr:hypothetical protein BV22DRAFT_1135285 [Leucogyrophana mollusca]
MPGDMESNEGKTEFSLTVVGAIGLPPFDNSHPTGFYVVVEVDGKQGRTVELAPSPQSAIEWNACFRLRADKTSNVALRLYECRKAVLPGDLRGGKVSYNALRSYEPWRAVVPGHLSVNKVSYAALRLYEHWKSVRPRNLGRGRLVWESRATAEQLLGSGSKFTNMPLPAKAPHEEGHLIVKAERAAHTEAKRPGVGEVDDSLHLHCQN